MAWDPRRLSPGLRSLCEGPQVSGTRDLFPTYDSISLQLSAVLILHQTRHNCIPFGDTAGVSQANPRGGQQGLRKEVWRAEAHCHSWSGSASRSRTAAGLSLGGL